MRMKVRYVLYNLCMLFGCICFSCTDPTNELLPSATTGLTIQISTGDGQTFTRAESSEAENTYNNKIQYLDIFIFDSNTGELVSKDADNKCYWHFGGKDEYGIPNDIVDPVLLIPGNWKTRFAGHAECDKLFGYCKYKDRTDYDQAVNTLFEKEILDNVDRGLSGCIYTQLADVENECNGLLSADRVIIKTDVRKMRKINERIYRKIR